MDSFWGSDDWAFSASIVENLLSALHHSASCLDLVVGRGQYVNSFGNPTRKTRFLFDGNHSSLLFV